MIFRKVTTSYVLSINVSGGTTLRWTKQTVPCRITQHGGRSTCSPGQDQRCKGMRISLGCNTPCGSQQKIILQWCKFLRHVELYCNLEIGLLLNCKRMHGPDVRRLRWGKVTEQMPRKQQWKILGLGLGHLVEVVAAYQDVTVPSGSNTTNSHLSQLRPSKLPDIAKGISSFEVLDKNSRRLANSKGLRRGRRIGVYSFTGCSCSLNDGKESLCLFFCIAVIESLNPLSWWKAPYDFDIWLSRQSRRSLLLLRLHRSTLIQHDDFYQCRQHQSEGRKRTNAREAVSRQCWSQYSFGHGFS